MGCSHGCNVAIQSDGKLTYVMGNFEPSSDAAEGIVKYASKHAESEIGQVPFREWPQAIKGHFVSRIPTLSSSK
jgi:predicted metal-binding protein